MPHPEKGRGCLLRVDRAENRVRFYLDLEDSGTEIPVPDGQSSLDIAEKLAAWIRSSGVEVWILQEGVNPS